MSGGVGTIPPSSLTTAGALPSRRSLIAHRVIAAALIEDGYDGDTNNQLDLSTFWSQTSGMEVAVAGAGIAGLSAAIAMTKAGHQVVVAEQATELREIGAALSLWPNALAALDHLGVGKRVRVAGLEAPTASIRSIRGGAIVRFDTDVMRRALGGLPLVVLRSGLQSILLEECNRLGVAIQLGQELTEVRPERRYVTIGTSAGEATFDAVIGADGIHSNVRLVVEPSDELRDCDRTAWRAVIPNHAGLISETWLTVGVGLQLIASPAPAGLVYWAADTPGSDAAKVYDADPRAILRRRFARWHQPIPEMIEATPPDSLIVDRIFDRRPPTKLQRGPILLVGDAAHPMTPDLGQGACQAIEDAAILLACATSRRDTDPGALFESFERVRLGRIRHIVRDSYRIGRLATAPSRLAAGTRDLVSRLVPETISNRRLAVYASSAAFRRQLEFAEAHQ